MKGLLTGVLLGMIMASPSYAYISAIAIQTDASSTMQVYVNGKLFNKQPGQFVRIKSKPGLFHVEVKVLNPHDKRWYLVKKDITVEKGYEFYYKMEFVRGRRPIITEVKRYPVYSRYFLKPSLYNKHYISMLKPEEIQAFFRGFS